MAGTPEKILEHLLETAMGNSCDTTGKIRTKNIFVLICHTNFGKMLYLKGKKKFLLDHCAFDATSFFTVPIKLVTLSQY